MAKKKVSKAKKVWVKSGKATTKKKVASKKVTTKKSAAKGRKRDEKKAPRTRLKKISMDDIYPIINKAQLGKKVVTFATHLIDSATIENTIRDAGVKYKKVEMRTQVVFTLYPSPTVEDDLDILDKMEFMEDEIPEWGQIFG